MFFLLAILAGGMAIADPCGALTPSRLHFAKSSGRFAVGLKLVISARSRIPYEAGAAGRECVSCEYTRAHCDRFTRLCNLTKACGTADRASHPNNSETVGSPTRPTSIANWVPAYRERWRVKNADYLPKENVTLIVV